MDSSKIRAVIIIIIATIVALYLGIGAATAQFETVGWVVGVGSLFACFLLGHKVWLLLPFLGALNLTLMIPGRPSTLLLAQVLVVGFCGLMLLARRLPYRIRVTEMEFWMGLLLVCVMQVYLRNPVSVNILGGSQVGGRPYALFLAAVVTAFVLSGLRVPGAELRTALNVSILGGLLNFVIGLAGWIWAPFGYWFGVASPMSSTNEVEDVGKATRVGFAVFLPITLAKWVSSFANPIRACFSPRWAPLVLISFGLAAASGYRNVIVSVGLTYLVGIFYRGGLVQLLGSGLIALMGLGGLAALNIVSPLPPNVQRTLSFLPGSWQERYVYDAKGSSEWRFEMWKEVLFTERWIDNKLLGDGLGFSARELRHQAQLNATGGLTGMGASGFDAAREYVLVTGDYHSGPVSAVRTIGYVGLIVMLLFQFRILVHAHRQIMRCKGTEWYPVALFFCIPMIWYPVFFLLIFGGFQKDAILLLMSAGMLRMLENNLPLPPYVVHKRERFVLGDERQQSKESVAGV